MGALTGHTPATTYGDIVQLGNAGAGVPATLQQVQDGLGNNTGLFLSATQVGLGGSDIGLKRVAAKVAAVTDGAGTNLAWLQEAGYLALASPFTSITNVMAVTTLSFNVIAGRSYQISGCLQVSNSTAAEGAAFDFNGGTATATTYFMSSTAVGSVVASVVVAVALATAIVYTTVTGTDYLQISGYLKVNAGGTLILRGAEGTAHTSGTVTFGAGSWVSLVDTPTA